MHARGRWVTLWPPPGILCMYVNPYMCMYTYTYISVCVIIHVYVTMGICIFVYIYIYTHMSADHCDGIHNGKTVVFG